MSVDRIAPTILGLAIDLEGDALATCSASLYAHTRGALLPNGVWFIRLVFVLGLVDVGDAHLSDLLDFFLAGKHTLFLV